ncbi:ShlB/FhaC/HecB family hemolysin secretion/activation protein [Candidatus Albibeggiatoa sp. nov. BB20]|uniref:ShlB/FhaC/HecB family hemolysin secretion/activation protein n=1 Tax=Candidatus Albibeggiatoa sp. nov. BB20 TaxID=3162723 RepID=UPI0033655E84
MYHFIQSSLIFLGVTILSLNVGAVDNNSIERDLSSGSDRLNSEFAEPKASILPPLPPLPDLYESGKAPLSALPTVDVGKFKFKGNTVYSSEFLSDLVTDYQDRQISAEELQMVKNIITRKYIEAGYINSGAIIPDQQVENGEIELEIIEGKLIDIDITNLKNNGEEGRLYPNYIKGRVGGNDGDVLNINTLQERLQLLHQNPLFRRINAELGPGIRLGEGILKLNVTEATPWELGARFNNHRSPSVGSYRGEVFGVHRNLLGLGDSIYLRLGLTEGLRDYSLNYSIPVSSRYGTTLAFSAERSDAEVVSEPFNQLNIESEAETYALGITQPLIKTPNQELNLGLKLERRSSTTYMFKGTPLEQKFSFSPGVQDGESRISVLRFSQDWLDRSRTRVIAARSSFNFGFDAWDATINTDGSPDGQFFTWLGQFQWVQRIAALGSQDTQLLIRADMQWANEDLLPLEKFSVGGASTVRGYRENQMTRDNGLVASIEWRIPVAKLAVPGISKDTDDGILQIAPFLDYGRAWNADADTPKPDNISSVGLGLRWMPSQRVNAILYWGHALRNVGDQQDDDLQDDGIHFEVNFSYPFE